MSIGLKPSVNESEDSLNPLDKSREALQIPQHFEGTAPVAGPISNKGTPGISLRFRSNSRMPRRL
jgi:hypothetical protein